MALISLKITDGHVQGCPYEGSVDVERCMCCGRCAGFVASARTGTASVECRPPQRFESLLAGPYG